MKLRLVLFASLGLASLALHAGEISIGTHLEVRLEKATGTRISKSGDAVEAILIAPVMDGDRVAIPAGSTLTGELAVVNKLGWGIKHSTAEMFFRFHRLVLPDGSTRTVETKVVEVETARERVDAAGRVQGIRAAGNISSSLATYAWRLTWIAPEVAIPVWATKFAVARAPDAEITFPAGTEMVLKVTAPINLDDAPDTDPIPGLGNQGLLQAQRWVAELPQQYAERPSGEPADILNVLLVGSQEQVQQAFKAAGWTGADRRTFWSVFRTCLTVMSRQPYSNAPMAKLAYDGRLPDNAYQKSLNTFSKRHHIRIWRNPATKGEESMWIATATEDTGFEFKLKGFHWTHSIDPKIDNERAKVVNDLIFTGCVDRAALVDRNLEYTAPVITDGRIAVLRLNGCESPRRAPDRPAPEHSIKAVAAAFGNDLVRSNFLFIGAQTAKLVTATRRAVTGAPAPPDRTTGVVEDQTMRQTEVLPGRLNGDERYVADARGDRKQKGR
jgi:hypothetical protein